MLPEVFPVTGDPEADQLLASDPLALIIGMLLDQQVPMEWAFKGPHRLRERLGGLDAAKIADMDPAELEAAFKEKPALHRFPSVMARRVQALCRHLVECHNGEAAQVWTGVTTGAQLLARVEALPGYGPEKARIFVALLAKRLGVRPPGWQDAAGPFADATPRSVADIDSAEALQRVREWKRAQKAQGKRKTD
jgi:uncharacterized HhH-GPD family protein